MRRRGDQKKKDGKWDLSFTLINRYCLLFCALVMIVVLIGCGALTLSRMRSNAETSLTESHARVFQRVDETIRLLESLASLPEFYDPELPPIDKVKKLDQMSPYFDCMMICYVDADIVVYSDGSEPASLASRDYMQRLFATGQRQVTDSFAAGADGTTLNYTVAVPLLNKTGDITGCLFCAIYFDEVADILEQSAGNSRSEITLIGSRGQIMSSTAGYSYGDSITKIFKDSMLFGITADRLEERLLAAQSEAYWSLRDGSLYYTVCRRVEHTNWDVLSSVNFWTCYTEMLPVFLLTVGFVAFFCMGLLWLIRRYISRQMKMVDVLVGSIEELENRIYRDERPETADFQEVLRLTGDGLSDSLTGVVTRSVFLNQAEILLKKADAKLTKALCFVDMDNLKQLNDSCGHPGGDIALKSIGYILREYEKKYDGVAGRYGGDEFVILMTGLDDEKELHSVLDELVTEALDKWLLEGGVPVTLFYFSIEGYTQAVRMIGPVEEERYLQNVSARLNGYIRSPFLAGRLDEGSYIIALREKMDEQEQEDFAKGLSLELLLQVRLNGRKSFLTARYRYFCCETGKSRAAEQIAGLIRAYYERVSGESPIRELTEKCRQLIEGKNDVVFDEYTDLEMMELSKTFNRYRRQVEQLAYSDPVFAVGNRLKYLRDTNMLISYDKKRRFSLYCVDICSFSQYNELFSADIGDEILHEVLRRLSRPFGSYLYRINGDVFLGVSLSGEAAASFAGRLQSLFAEPVLAGSLSFTLQVRVAACLYPENGETPISLLDHIQSAMRFAKESDRAVIVYNGQLDKMIRTEAGILRRMKEAVRQETLEVWYQPIMRLADQRFHAAEALVRLPDGKGGFYSAGQVVSLAERSGIVEELGDYVLRQACLFMREQGGKTGLTRIGVNISVQQLLVRNSADHLLKIIRSGGFDPRSVTLEITESILIQSIDQAAQELEKLRLAGVRIALDDFGVGYSSLNYLSNLPVDIIKIDRSLTRQILTSPKQYTLLKTIVEMAEINELAVVAEGVETQAEQEAAAEAGVHYIQGYFYARPMPGEELCRFLDH